MYVTFRTRPSWRANSTITICLCIAFLLGSQLAKGAQKLGERAFQELTQSQISSLVSNSDPLKNLDPSKPDSHLSKILIPRARESEFVTLFTSDGDIEHLLSSQRTRLIILKSEIISSLR